MLSEYFREQRAFPWQRNLGKKAKIAQISVLYKILIIFGVSSRVLRVSEFKYILSEFSRDQRELPGQPHLSKISQNCTDFSSVEKIQKFFL